MVREAVAHGLIVDEDRFKEIVPNIGNDKYAAPDPAAVQHDELSKFGWRVIEHLPRRYIDVHTDPPSAKWSWAPFSGFYRARPMAEKSCLHGSVEKRMELKPDFRPKNHPGDYSVEE